MISSSHQVTFFKPMKDSLKQRVSIFVEDIYDLLYCETDLVLIKSDENEKWILRNYY